MGLIFPRTTCEAPKQYYTCSDNGFAGCCSVNACSSPQGCPDSGSPGQSFGASTSSVVITAVHSSTLISIRPALPTASFSLSHVATTSQQGGALSQGTPTSSIIKASTTTTASHATTTKTTMITATSTKTMVATSSQKMTVATSSQKVTALKSVSSSSRVTSHAPSATSTASPHPSNSHGAVLIGVAVAGVFVLIIIIIVLVRCCLRIKRGRKELIARAKRMDDERRADEADFRAQKRRDEERYARGHAVFDPNNVF